MTHATALASSLTLASKPFATAILALGSQIKSVIFAEPMPHWTEYLRDCNCRKD